MAEMVHVNRELKVGIIFRHSAGVLDLGGLWGRRVYSLDFPIAPFPRLCSGGRNFRLGAGRHWP